MIANSKYTEKIIVYQRKVFLEKISLIFLEKISLKCLRISLLPKKPQFAPGLSSQGLGDFLCARRLKKRRILNHDSRVRAPQDKFGKKHVHLHNYIQQLCALLFFKKIYTFFVLRIKLQFGKNQHTYKVTTKWEHWNWNEADN